MAEAAGLLAGPDRGQAGAVPEAAGLVAGPDRDQAGLASEPTGPKAGPGRFPGRHDRDGDGGDRVHGGTRRRRYRGGQERERCLGGWWAHPRSLGARVGDGGGRRRRQFEEDSGGRRRPERKKMQPTAAIPGSPERFLAQGGRGRRGGGDGALRSAPRFL